MYFPFVCSPSFPQTKLTFTPFRNFRTSEGKGVSVKVYRFYFIIDGGEGCQYQALLESPRKARWKTGEGNKMLSRVFVYVGLRACPGGSITPPIKWQFKLDLGFT